MNAIGPYLILGMIVVAVLWKTGRLSPILNRFQQTAASESNAVPSGTININDLHTLPTSVLGVHFQLAAKREAEAAAMKAMAEDAAKRAVAAFGGPFGAPLIPTPGPPPPPSP